MFLTTEKREVSSANNFGFDAGLSDKSLMYIKKVTEPRIEPQGTPASTFVYGEFWSFVFCNLKARYTIMF